MSRTLHMVASVRGLLRWPNTRLKGMFLHESGKRMSGKEVREILFDQLAMGHEVIPVGEPCEGFDYKTGCPGHETADETGGAS